MQSIKKFLRRLIFRLRADYTTEQLVEMGLIVGITDIVKEINE